MLWFKCSENLDMNQPQWQPSPQQLTLIRRYSRSLEEGEAALFAGAGLSQAAGFVDWKRLLKEVAEDLDLNIDLEPDLVAVAQFHLNSKQNRNFLNQMVIDQFARQAGL